MNADTMPEPSVRRNLNVCMLSYSFYESDNRVMRYAEALAARGDHVDVIALQREGAQKAEQINGVNVFRVQKRKRNESRKLDYLFRILRFWLVSAWMVTRKHVARRYDIIHVHSVPDFEVLAAVLPKWMGAKIILDIHDIVPEFFAAKFSSGNNSRLVKALKMVEKVSAAFSDHVIISNHIWEKKLLSRSVPAEKCTTIINYPDQGIFQKMDVEKDSDHFLCMYPGTLNWHQGLDIAIRAIARIKDEIPQVRFLIYGDGPSKKELEQLVKSLGLDEIIGFFPPLPLRQIARVMATADAGIIPKRNDAFGGEAFSTKTLEFMSLGVPIIVSQTKIDNFYFDDSLVLFFEPEDVASLAHAIVRLVRDDALRKRLSENGLRYAATNSWNHKKQMYFNLVDALAAKSR